MYVFTFYQETQIIFPKLYQFTLLLAMDEAWLLQILVDSRILSNFKICAHWLGVKWYLTIILICISQITKEDK